MSDLDNILLMIEEIDETPLSSTENSEEKTIIDEEWDKMMLEVIIKKADEKEALDKLAAEEVARMIAVEEATKIADEEIARIIEEDIKNIEIKQQQQRQYQSYLTKLKQKKANRRRFGLRFR